MPRGDCHYLAGSVARFSELHLLVRGTTTVIGTCGLVPHLKMNKGTISGSWLGTREAHRLKNGLCVYDTREETQYLKITN